MNSYRNLCTEFYEIDKPTPPQDELDFYLNYARQANGPILEAMCGTGRFLVPLAEKGFDIDGMDASQQMLERCRSKCRDRGLSIYIYQQFLHQLELPRRYELVLITAGSFSLITDLAEVRQSLKRIHAVMKPGAKFVFETNHHKPAGSSSWGWGGRWVQRSDGAKIISSWLGQYDADQSISHDIHRYELIKDGQLLATELEDLDRRYYDPSELQGLLGEAGFDQFKTFKVHGIAAPTDSDKEIILECTKLDGSPPN